MMIKALSYIFMVSVGALGVLTYLPVMLDYYYSVLVLVGILQGIRTFTGSYNWLIAFAAMIYGIENNDDIWLELGANVLTIIYFIAAPLVYFTSRSDDGLKAAQWLTVILLAKWALSAAYPTLYESSYMYHTLINLLSIASWVTIITVSSERLKINRGYAKKDNPFTMAVIWTMQKIGVSNALSTGRWNGR